jgi:predicted DsbA family dithiol-disulfide isomerase
LNAAEKLGLDIEKLKADMKSKDVEDVLGGNMSIAQTLGINGTPAFIIDDKLIPGAVGYETLVGTVEQVRDAGGCKVC